MKRLSCTLSAAVMLTGLAFASPAAMAGPLGTSSALAGPPINSILDRDAKVEHVQGRRGNWRGNRAWRGNRGGGIGLGIGAGILGGALLGSALAAPYYDRPYRSYPRSTYYGRPSDDAVAYCSSRFRSYDPASGTYLGYDGLRHACP